MLVTIFVLAAMSAAATQPLLEPWSALAGHCWAGPAPGGGTDTHCFESVYGGQHIRDRHSVTVDGRVVYSGESLYSAAGPKVIFTYWNSLGGLGTGEAAINGSKWTFSGTIHATAAGKEQPMNAVWIVSTDGYAVEDKPGTSRQFKRAD
ncbi:MAG: hypothetical protein ABIS39_00250 [Sphingomicrobium sp.]